MCLKAQGVEKLRSRKNLFLIDEDLSEKSLKDTLLKNKVWDMSTQTIIVAEGLLMCLSVNTVEELFRQCMEVTGSESWFVLIHIPSGSDGQLNVGAGLGL